VLHFRTVRRIAVIAIASAAVLAAPALAKEKSVSNEAKWIKFDEASSTITVEILNNGRGNKKLMDEHKDTVSRGKEVTFKVKPSGSILTRTSVKVNGQRGELADIREGKQVNIYWTEDESGEGLFARTIDVTISEEEFDRRYETE
jgi:hypothetical protein